MSGPPIPECWDYKGGHPIYALLGIKVQCFMHARWGLYPLSHMPSPRVVYVSYKKKFDFLKGLQTELSHQAWEEDTCP